MIISIEDDPRILEFFSSMGKRDFGGFLFIKGRRGRWLPFAESAVPREESMWGLEHVRNNKGIVLLDFIKEFYPEALL